jgi:hypothetical protein
MFEVAFIFRTTPRLKLRSYPGPRANARRKNTRTDRHCTEKRYDGETKARRCFRNLHHMSASIILLPPSANRDETGDVTLVSVRYSVTSHLSGPRDVAFAWLSMIVRSCTRLACTVQSFTDLCGYSGDRWECLPLPLNDRLA